MDGRGRADGLTHDETEKRKTEEVKKLSGEIGATNERSVAAHAAENLYPDAPSSSSPGRALSSDTQAGFHISSSSNTIVFRLRC